MAPDGGDSLAVLLPVPNLRPGTTGTPTVDAWRDASCATWRTSPGWRGWRRRSRWSTA